MHAIRNDVDGIMTARQNAENAWSGPKRLARNIILIGSALAAIGGIVVFFGPAIMALL